MLGVRNCCLLYGGINIWLRKPNCINRAFPVLYVCPRSKYLFCTVNSMFQEQLNAVRCEVTIENIALTISIGCILLLVTIWRLSVRNDFEIYTYVWKSIISVVWNRLWYDLLVWIIEVCLVNITIICYLTAYNLVQNYLGTIGRGWVHLREPLYK